ncbi:MAG: membrane protein [marine bacterium B5-7]|nr:MAG: membrane protein [marine bacterium B5-7]
MPMDDFLFRAVIAGIGMALICGVLGVFVVWRRMAYFGDTVAHAAMLGVVLGLLAGMDLNLAVLLVAAAVAIALQLLSRRRAWSSDTLLGILSHGSLAVGLVMLSIIDTVRLDLMALLFGDILSVTQTDIIRIWIGGGIVMAVTALVWRGLLSITVHEDLARVEGVRVMWVETLLMLMVATVIAIAMKIVGIILVTSLLVIPAATARRFSSGPEQMALISALAGVFAVVAGLAGSWQWDTPAGPSIVVAALSLFLLSSIVPVSQS